jgi:hypothetical protein
LSDDGDDFGDEHVCCQNFLDLQIVHRDGDCDDYSLIAVTADATATAGAAAVKTRVVSEAV